MIEIVAASPRTQAKFLATAPLGQSLRRLAGDPRLAGRIRCGNTGPTRKGLPAIFNRRIAAAPVNTTLVFTHDDVWLNDALLAERLEEALQRFDIVGVAGCRRDTAKKTTWAFADDVFTREKPSQLSGEVAHGPDADGPITVYGRTPAPCDLLDGVFLAAKAGVLRRSQLRFDERFRFHFYDLDFCREARQRGLRVGTWPIALTHRSGGAFGSPAWAEERDVYLEKWRRRTEQRCRSRPV